MCLAPFVLLIFDKKRGVIMEQFKEYVTEKMRLLRQMGVMGKITRLERTKLIRSKNEVECDNIAHSLIMKYL